MIDICPVLDENFDCLEDSEYSVVSYVRRNGVISVGTEGQGIHDGMLANSDSMPQILIHPKWTEEEAEKEAKSISAANRKMAAMARASLRSAGRLKAQIEQKKSREEQLLIATAWFIDIGSMSKAEYEQLLYEEAKNKILMFPHADNKWIWQVALEFAQFGREDAKRRGISEDEWIWRRSRFMAGYK